MVIVVNTRLDSLASLSPLMLIKQIKRLVPKKKKQIKRQFSELRYKKNSTQYRIRLFMYLKFLPKVFLFQLTNLLLFR